MNKISTLFFVLMAVFASWQLSAQENCMQIQLSNNAENAVYNEASGQQVASDLVLFQNTATFTLDSIQASIFTAADGLASVDIKFFEDGVDANGNPVPGTQIGSTIMGLVPSNVEFITDAFGMTDNLYTFILPTPQVFTGSDTEDTHYWVQLIAYPNTPDGPPDYFGSAIEVTSASVVGYEDVWRNPGASPATPDWTPVTDSYDSVISFYGECAYNGCVSPSASYEVVSDCGNGPQFLVAVHLYGMGGSNSLVISDNASSATQTATAPGTFMFGPYPNGSLVHITVANADEATCSTTSGDLTQYCCTGPPVTTSGAFTVDQLITDVLINTPCSQITNITSSSGDDFGEQTGIGKFMAAEGTVFPIDSGVVMSTGYLTSVPGPRVTGSSDGTYGWPGDPDITDIIHQIEGNNTADSNNASVIEFDFVPYADHISFNYVFASDEYGTFQCTYTDAFAFLLTDADGNTTNLAVVPGTTIPVSVRTIRDGQYHSGCPSANIDYFGNYYDDLDPNACPGSADPINFHGFTVPLTAQADVTPGETYHIKLAIADRSDWQFDSAVFLEAGSLDIGTIDLGPNLTLADGNAPCESESVTLNSGIPVGSSFVQISWYKGNNLLSGETGETLVVTESGTYTVVVILGGTCVLSDTIEVQFVPTPAVDLGADFSICSIGGTSILDATPTNSADLGTSLTYTWYLDGTVIPGETAATLSIDQAGTYKAVVNTSAGCTENDSVVVTDFSFAVDLGDDQEFCNQASYDLTAALTGTNPSSATFAWTGPNGPISATTQTITVSESGTYTVTVNVNSCTASDSVDMTFNNVGPVNLTADGSVDQTFRYCENDPSSIPSYSVTLTAALGGNPTGQVVYTWYKDNVVIQGATGNTYTASYSAPDDFGSYDYKVVASVGDCSVSATISTAIVLEPYEHPCTISQGLSPGDNNGINDILDLTFLSDRSGIASLEVYNRYGTKVYNKDNYVDQWHGQDNDGNDLGTGTYYYILEMKNNDPVFGKVKKGWIYINQKLN